jgi:hypothetical protein
MSHPHALSALVSLRNEFAGKISALQKEVARVDSEISTLDAAIKIIDPSFKLNTLRAKQIRSKNVFFPKHGEASRFVLDALRESSTTLSTTEITELVISQKGLNKASINLKALKSCILMALSRQRINGAVVEKGRCKDGTIKWSLGG